MLRYMGSIQPPRKYVFFDESTFHSQAQPLCSHCSSQVWTSTLFSALRTLPFHNTRSLTSYEIRASDLRSSVSQGCKWCKSLADGIHGRVFLDSLYERWNKTESWPSDGSHGVEDEKEEQTVSEDNAESDGTENDWNGASAYNDDMEDDPTGGWDSYEDLDTLALKCRFRVKMSFEREEGGVFTFVNAHIEAIDGDESNELQKLRGDKAVELRYYINITGSASLQSKLFPLTTVSTAALGSEPNMKYICDWVQKSDLLTSSSRENLSYFPRRLIDVSAESGLRIVEASDILPSATRQARGFVALSYVWGTDQAFVLLEANKKAMMSRFDIEALPRTIRDAVKVTRRLNFNHIWVDSLCIIQDSKEDKATEIPNMRQIYQCATVTIVASVAQSATKGFLDVVAENTFLVDPIEVPYPDPGSDAKVVLSYPAEYKRWKDPINHRAWTFQELLLSPRAIMFSYRGVETVDRRNIPEANGLTSGKEVQLPNLPWNGRLFTLDQKGEKLRQVWLAVRGEYSRRQLTYEGDRLVAIAAVAEEIGRSYGCRYLAGMWERDLATDLQWCRPPCIQETNSPMPDMDELARKPRSANYIAPSWSWASVAGEVHDSGYDGEGEVKGELGFEVVRCEVEPAVPNFVYGAVRSGTLVIKGRVHSFFWRPQKVRNLMTCDGFLAVKAEKGPHAEYQVGEAMIDALEPELVEGCVVDCVAMTLIERIPGKEEVEGLVLLPIDETRHRRVGFFKVQSIALFEDIEPMQITIM